MDIYRAKEILTVLADGVNPLTGEVLESDNICNQPDVIRALHAILDYLPAEGNVQHSRNSGNRWTDADKLLLCRLFDEGKGKQEICNRLGRSEDGVAAQLVKLGKIEIRDDFRKRME